MSEQRLTSLGIKIEAADLQIQRLTSLGIKIEAADLQMQRLTSLGLMVEARPPYDRTQYLTSLGILIEINVPYPKYIEDSENFTIGGTYNDAFNLIRKLLYEHTVYNTAITLQSLPLYQLEPNTLLSLNSKRDGIQGEYLINNISIPLSYAEPMTINAFQALERL